MRKIVKDVILIFKKLKYEQYFENYTFKIGNEIIFWGVNESFNIIDIINQSNLAEDISGTKKFGQPMISLNYNHSYGNFDLFIMPFFKERIFPGRNGRPRLALEVDKSTVAYESSSKEKIKLTPLFVIPQFTMITILV